jgi:hypothetical protein
MERASVATDGDSRTAMDGPDLKQSCPLEWVPQGLTEQLRFVLPEGDLGYNYGVYSTAEPT